jgi:dihydrofolate reductase
MAIDLIAAVGKRGQLGLGGRMPWHSLEDLRWFKQMTMGGVVVVGHNTALGLPPLPGRRVLIDYPALTPENLELFADGAPIWIAGGAKTYARWLPHIRHAIITMIDYDGPADVWMPHLWGPHKE